MEKEIITEMTAIMREADQVFETIGGSTRHYVRDVLLPMMEEKGFMIVKKDQLATTNETIKVLTYDNNQLKRQVEGYKEAHDDHKRLVRHLDLLINGDAAAEQASLCDLVKQIESFGLPAVNNQNYKGGADWVKASATGWRPLLEEVLKLDDLDVAYISEELIEKIKTFLYGE